MPTRSQTQTQTQTQTLTGAPSLSANSQPNPNPNSNPNLNRCAECERGASAKERRGGEGGAERTASRAELAAAIDLENRTGLTPMFHSESGTLSDGRIHIKQSTIGEHSGLGLFAGCTIPPNEVICTYFGTPLYREHLSPDFDTSYVVRLPNSGGALMDGKPYADAVRANPANPDERGR